MKNEEIRTIISALGTGIGADFNIANLNYDKVIILSDADQDGAHIRAILLTFFFRYMKELVQEGHVYIGMPPLYKVYKKILSSTLTTITNFRKQSIKWAGAISCSVIKVWAK